MNLDEYIKEHGIKGISTLVKELILKAPEFGGDKDLAKKLALVVTDLEYALVVYKNKSDSNQRAAGDECRWDG
jgi:hypothetical protein